MQEHFRYNREEMSKIVQFFFLIGMLCFISGVLLMYKAHTRTQDNVALPQQPQQPLFPAIVLRVIDGDTVLVSQLSIQEKVRLIGIDAPETVDRQKPVGCFGKEASERMRQLLNGKLVYLQADNTQADKDMYGRLLRYIYLPNKTMVNEILLQEGFAKEYTFGYHAYIFQHAFRQLEAYAQKEKNGLWGKCE